MKLLKLFAIMQICAIQSFTQELEPDSDENLVSFYLLPVPLTCLDGSKVIKAAEHFLDEREKHVIQ